MTNKEYLMKEKHIWHTFVPNNGQAEYTQGELLRALAKLQDEAQRNGNINWDRGHVILAKYILTTIEKSELLNNNQLNQLKDDIAILLNYKSPHTDDELYTRIAHIIVDFFIKYPDPIRHERNPSLNR